MSTTRRQDAILNSIQPVNQPQKKRGRPRKQPETIKEQTKARHQTPLHRAGEEANEHMGLGSVDPEIIEKQIALGLGLWHPNNVDKIPLETLKKDVQKLKKAATKSRPSPVTPLSILTETLKSPSDFYTGPSPASSLNNVDAFVSDVSVGLSSDSQFKLVDEEGSEVEKKNVVMSFEQVPTTASGNSSSNFVPLNKVAQGVCDKITQDNQYHLDRCVAYVDYFHWVIQKLEESQESGKRYDKQLKLYESGMHLYNAALTLYQEQAAYENSLTPYHRKIIQQEERLQFLEAQLKESASE